MATFRAVDTCICPSEVGAYCTQSLFGLGQVPKPAKTWLFLDEHPDTINDGYFMNVWDETKWGNLPASYHNGSGNIAWADGHLERHHWLPDTIRPAVKGGASGGFVPASPADYLWLREHTSVKLN